MKKTPITAQGAQKLRDELRNLKSVERAKIIQAIADARELGDLKENAEYHAAREQQSFTEGRIAELESKLATAEIIDIKKVNANGKIVFGATVNLMNIDTEQEIAYQIVGDDEADIKANRISISSPIARALIGKEEGDVATVKAPGGNKEYEILEVNYI
ncbi:transcription elongation factor GreA [Candidatus Halobeggiatoa sp. HSG11]|nr:transcription elongation factor GreA [Candidatus Halobeggiatoa sp. HSG11]